MVNTFGTIGSIVAINFIAFRGVAQYDNCELYTRQVLNTYLYSVTLSFLNLEVTTVVK